MKIVFIKFKEGFLGHFTCYKTYDVIKIELSGHFKVIDDSGGKNIIFKDECVELEEYKKQLVKERFEQK